MYKSTAAHRHRQRHKINICVMCAVLTQALSEPLLVLAWHGNVTARCWICRTFLSFRFDTVRVRSDDSDLTSSSWRRHLLCPFSSERVVLSLRERARSSTAKHSTSLTRDDQKPFIHHAHSTRIVRSNSAAHPTKVSGGAATRPNRTKSQRHVCLGFDLIWFHSPIPLIIFISFVHPSENGRKAKTNQKGKKKERAVQTMYTIHSEPVRRLTATGACRRGSTLPARRRRPAPRCRRRGRPPTVAAAPPTPPTPTCRRTRRSPPAAAAAAPPAPAPCSTPARGPASWTASWTTRPAPPKKKTNHTTSRRAGAFVRTVACWRPPLSKPVGKHNKQTAKQGVKCPCLVVQVLLEYTRKKLTYGGDVDGDDVGLAALVQEPDGEVARRPALLLHAYRQVAVLGVLAGYPARAYKKSISFSSSARVVGTESWDDDPTHARTDGHRAGRANY